MTATAGTVTETITAPLSSDTVAQLSEAAAMIVAGFVEPITKELPLEYAVEMNRLIQLQMEGSVG